MANIGVKLGMGSWDAKLVFLQPLRIFWEKN